MSDVTERLTAPFKPTEVKFKPQSVKGNRALALAYIDCRLIQDRLDEVLGVENWTDDYEILTDGSVMCRLRLRLNGEWVTKVDVGSPSEQPDVGDRLKAAFSDAMKRAAVKFGIGRYLYRLPAVWCDYDSQKRQFIGTPQLPAWALPKGQGEKAAPPQQQRAAAGGRFATVDALLAEMEAKGTPPNAVSLADRVKWCDAELARLKGQAFRAGSLIAAVCGEAKVATFQQLTSLPPGDRIGVLWQVALTNCHAAAGAAKPSPASPQAAGLNHQTLRELITWTETAASPAAAERLANRVAYLEDKFRELCPPAMHYRPGEFTKAVCEFARVRDAAQLKLIEHQKDVDATWANAKQFVGRIKDQAKQLAAAASSRQ